MWPNPQETADLVTFTEEILNGNFIFYAVRGFFVQVTLQQVMINVPRDQPAISQEVTANESETVAWRCSIKKLFLKILQNLQENTCTGASFQ